MSLGWVLDEPIFWFALGWALVALAGAALTELGPWYYGLRQPSWKPPDWLFGPAWTVIFALAAVAGAEAYERAATPAAQNWVIALSVLNGALNMAWSLLFFKLKRPAWALAEIAPFWLSILALALALGAVSLRAGLFLVPYLIWVAFAAGLNYAIVRMNQSRTLA